MNLRPSGYEPDELPDCSTPQQTIKDLVATYVRTGSRRYYHRHGAVSLPSSEWDRVVPARHDRQAKPRGRRRVFPVSRDRPASPPFGSLCSRPGIALLDLPGNAPSTLEPGRPTPGRVRPPSSSPSPKPLIIMVDNLGAFSFFVPPAIHAGVRCRHPPKSKRDNKSALKFFFYQKIRQPHSVPVQRNKRICSFLNFYNGCSQRQPDRQKSSSGTFVRSGFLPRQS